jgi:large subunit ribosomal protein L9
VEVILLEEVTGLGTRGATVKVSPGYARNYLLPRKLAIAATGNTGNLFKTLAKQRETRDAKLHAAAEALAARLTGAHLTIPALAGEEGVLFGSVSPADVCDALAKRGFAVERRQVHLEEHIKSLGVHEVAIRLHGGVGATVTVEVVPQ